MIKITERPKWSDMPMPSKLAGPVIDIGCSFNSRRHVNQLYYSVDICKDTRPDIVADAENLPLKNESIRSVLCLSMIEHTPNPSRVLDECERVMKKNARLYISAPFIYYEHDARDYQRFTVDGFRILLKKFRVLSVRKVYNGFFSTHIGLMMPITYLFGNHIKKLLQNTFYLLYVAISPIDIGKDKFYGGIHCVAKKM